MADADVLAFDHVTIEHRGRRGAATRILDDVSFTIAPGTAFGLVGESGCGKSTAALAAMRYLPAGMGVAKGRIDVLGRDIAALSSRELRELRGNRIAMIYQDPMSSLNPVMTVGAQLIEVPLLHGETSTAKARERAIAMLGEVRLADPAAAMERYPHELSGGQQQRVVIAMALMAEPALLIMDEPTTGLDVTIEAAILELVRDLRVRFGAAVLFISHNLGAVARVCDHIGVLYAGRMVETGPIGDVLKRPAHPYTRGLLRALPGGPSAARGATLEPIPGIVSASDRARIGCAFAARCAFHRHDACDDQPIAMRNVAGSSGHTARCARLDQAAAEMVAPGVRAVAAPARRDDGERDVVLAVRGLSKVYRAQGMFGARGPGVKAATGVSFEARRGTTLAIVGESGCGKSTVAKILAGLVAGTGGEAVLEGVNLATTAVDRRPWELRRRVQMVFQNPDSTLNPSHTVEYALSRPLRRLKGLSRHEARAEVERLAERVRLPKDLLRRLPHQLSGGQRQRVAIARALAGDPEILVADEPVSALDVSVQAAIVNLLQELQQRSELSLVVISHDLALVRHMADWIAVMYLGHVVEYGPAEQVLAPPYHPYTEALLAAAPVVDPDAPPPEIVLAGTMPSPSAEISGCPFASRCPRKVGAICDTTPPPEKRYGAHVVACHAG
ncbi:MAG: ABC transporter ATP-binding protein [Hyphomicrobiales bacterium]|nr:ABC transporter ATP-binding protein [Hyphomicrobiales bacterium]